jgi:Tol biopolymer transport system component
MLEVEKAGLKMLKPEDERGSYRYPCWSATGTEVFALGKDNIGTKYWLLKISRATDKESVLFESPRWLDYLSCSPDGSKLAFVAEGHYLKVMAADGGAPLDLNFGSYGIITATAFSADGRYVYFATAGDAPNLHRVPVTGGTVEPLGLQFPTIADLAIHPNGTQIAFSSRKSEVEFWAMENWLPLTTDRQ